MSPYYDLQREVELRRTEMSKRELGRVEVLARVRSKQLRLVDAGQVIASEGILADHRKTKISALKIREFSPYVLP